MSALKMNYTSAIFLINDKVSAVKVSYELNMDGSPKGLYTFKTFDTSLTKGDFVVVPTTTRHGMTICRVEEVGVDIDLTDETTQFKWIVGRVDRTNYDDILRKEASAIATIKNVEIKKQRDELRENLFSAYQEQLKQLPLASMGTPTEQEIPSAPPRDPNVKE